MSAAEIVTGVRDRGVEDVVEALRYAALGGSGETMNEPLAVRHGELPTVLLDRPYVAHNCRVLVRFTQSARRHRIGRAHARYVMETCTPTVVPADEEHGERLVWVGLDDRHVDLEVVAVREPDYLLVIHVMPHSFNRRAR